MHTELIYILPTALYHLTLPTLSSLLRDATSRKLSFCLLLYHLPYPIFLHSFLNSPGSNASLLLPLCLILLLISQIFHSFLPILIAFPLLSFIRAKAAACVTILPVHHLARIDLLTTLISSIAPFLYFIPTGIVSTYLVCILISLISLFQQHHTNTDNTTTDELTPLLKHESVKYGPRLLLPLLLTAFSTATIYHSYPMLCHPTRPMLLSILCFTGISALFFQRLHISHAQILGVGLSLAGSVLLMKSWFGAGVFLLGCGGAAVGVCAMRDIMEDRNSLEEGVSERGSLQELVVLTGVTFAIGESIGVMIGGMSPRGRVWLFASLVMLAVLLVRELIRMARAWGNAIHGFVGVLDIERANEEVTN